MIPVNVYSFHTMAGVKSKLPFKSHKFEISVKVLHRFLCLSRVKAEALQLLLHNQHPLSVYDQILQMCIAVSESLFVPCKLWELVSQKNAESTKSRTEVQEASLANNSELSSGFSVPECVTVDMKHTCLKA